MENEGPQKMANDFRRWFTHFENEKLKLKKWFTKLKNENYF